MNLILIFLSQCFTKLTNFGFRTNFESFTVSFNVLQHDSTGMNFMVKAPTLNKKLLQGLKAGNAAEFNGLATKCLRLEKNTCGESLHHTPPR